MKYIIEHMDPELWDWSVLEYRNVAKHVGRNNLIVSNVPQDEEDKLDGVCETENLSVSLMGLARVCVLDPEAEKELSPSDAEEFDYLVFGGILGDYPPKARTRELHDAASARLRCQQTTQ